MINEPIGADLRVCVERDTHPEGENTGSPLPTVVQWFKTMTTNEYIRGVKHHGWQPFLENYGSGITMIILCAMLRIWTLFGIIFFKMHSNGRRIRTIQRIGQ